ncbi:MAG: hypothetical protein ACE5D4_08850 [Thermodesulfobacteriota bacterium]
MGKTRLLRDIERRCVVSIAERDSPPEYLPLYLEADEMHRGFDIVIKDKIEEGLGLARYTPEKIKGFIRHLRNNSTIFAIIDAFDQVTPGGEADVGEALSNDTKLGKCKCYISMRPYMEPVFGDHLKGKDILTRH